MEGKGEESVGRGEESEGRGARIGERRERKFESIMSTKCQSKKLAILMYLRSDRWTK